jgi:hypothetical protein
MPKRPSEDSRQLIAPWTDPFEVLKRAPPKGDVVFESPDSSRLTRSRAARIPKVRVSPAGRAEILSLGLPFGLTTERTCWACGVNVDRSHRVGPGLMICPGCGAKLPFEE